MTSRLPKDIVPTHYELDIHSIDLRGNSFKGDLAITLEVKKASSKVMLNANELRILEASAQFSLSKTESQVTASKIEVNEKFQTVQISFPQTLPLGQEVTLKLHYHGTIQTNMTGFYRSDYDGKVMLSTQFEATDARKAFPCFDEPNFKASFALSVCSTEDSTVLSNMPVLSSKLSTEGKKGPTSGSSKRVVFDTTPKMSTYLVAWAIGELEYIENTDSIPVRVYTTGGISEQGRFALEFAVKVLSYYNEIFQIAYPLPKLDLLAVHDFSCNAMENFGLCTFRSTALLFDPHSSDSSYQQRVAYVVAHELAHQWFGNLVTMDWWNELWLNEGFATWVGYKAVDKFYPEWDVFSSFVAESLQTALELDSLRNSHPIEVPVESALDIDQVFDAISYLKGASVIRMLSSAISEETFLQGVSLYLKTHQYGNATTLNLWEAVAKASSIDIPARMHAWIHKIGFPVITVTLEDGKVVAHQSRFLAGGDAHQEENKTLWWAPLGSSDLQERSIEVGPNLKLNPETTGFFRVNYKPAILKEMASSSLKQMSVRDQVGVLSDSAACARAGMAETSSFLDLVFQLKDTDSYFVWLEIIKRLDQLQSVWSQQPRDIQSALQKTCAHIYGDKATELGFEPAESEPLTVSKLRSALLLAAGLAKVPEVCSQARSIFQKWCAGEGSIPASLRLAIFSTVLSDEYASPNDFNKILNEALHPSSLDAREIALKALGHAAHNQYDLNEKAVKLLLTDAVPPMDAHYLVASLAANPACRDKLWEFFTLHYDQIYEAYSTPMVVMDRVVRAGLCQFNTFSVHKEIQDFFHQKSVSGFERSLNQALDHIATNTNWAIRDAKDVELWLSKMNYL